MPEIQDSIDAKVYELSNHIQKNLLNQFNANVITKSTPYIEHKESISKIIERPRYDMLFKNQIFQKSSLEDFYCGLIGLSELLIYLHPLAKSREFKRYFTKIGDKTLCKMAEHIYPTNIEVFYDKVVDLYQEITKIKLEKPEIITSSIREKENIIIENIRKINSID